MFGFSENDPTITSLHLDNYVWKNRIVLIFADQEGKELLKKQVDHLLEERSGLLDRQLLVFALPDNKSIKEAVHGNFFYANEDLKRDYNKTGAKFCVVLIGKDGGVKYQSDAFLQSDKLYAIIDAMPMRRAEMKR